MTKLKTNDFYELIEKSLQSPNYSDEALFSEEALASRVHDRLAESWEHGWDFCVENNFFGERGVSVLIQNTKIDWHMFWDWILAEFSTCTQGAIVNFEVWSNIKDDTLVAGDMIARRLLLSEGSYEESLE
ncbi:hypothetical protein NT6N_04280 [Oceaniferula spumae]|uniref:Uncharacterized protein n=1 Tax=Oceaniferula spumae TaxID=2979115 RepID=A0AAT9FHC5_9BACT